MNMYDMLWHNYNYNYVFACNIYKKCNPYNCHVGGET